MAREVNFTSGTIVTPKFLNDIQQGLTGAVFGGYFAPHASDSAKVALSPGGYETVAPIVLSNGDGGISSDYVVGYQAGTVNSAAASGSAGARDIWVSTSTAAQLSTPGVYSVSILETSATPGDAYRRKVGSATWDGATLSNVKLANGVMADAEQRNSFVFRSVLAGVADIPLTLRGRVGQGVSGSKMLSVGYDTGSTYGEKWALSSTGLATTRQATSTDDHYRAYVTSAAQPILSLNNALNFGPGGSSAVDTSISRNGVGVAKIIDTLDVVSIQNSNSSAGSVLGAVNILDDLNVNGTIKTNGTLLSSADLSDVATLALLASPTFTGTPGLPTGTTGVTQAVDNSTTKLATTAFVIGQAASASPLMDGSVAVGTSTRLARADHVHPIDTSRAPLASPNFTGTPTLPTGTIATTQSPGNNTTAVATTAFVTAGLAAALVSPTFTGTPTLPTGTIATTQSVGNTTTAVATTAYVMAAITAGAVSDASTTVKGATKLSVAPVSSSAPIAVGDNDTRVTADQASGTASIRTLGTGSAQAAAGNHAHSFGQITGTIAAGQYAAASIANAEIASSAAIAYSKLALTGAILNADLAGSIALAKLATDPLARANHTGTQLAATVSDFATAVAISAYTKAQVDTSLALKANLAGPSFTGTVNFAGALVVSTMPSAGTTAFQFLVTADSSSRFSIGANGGMQWGPGSAVADVELTRIDVGTLFLNHSGAATRAAIQVTDAPVAGSDLVNKTYADLKAPLASPTFTGTPSLPTGTTGVTQSALDSSTKLSTTEFVTTANALKANLASPTFTGTPSLPTGTTGITQSALDSSTKLATTAFVTTANALKADLVSPTFTGTPSLPTGTTGVTQSAGDSSTKLATTAFVTTVDVLKAPLASPTFTGTPSLPTGTTGVTQSAADSSTKLATTAYADAADSLKANLASPTFTGTVTVPAPVGTSSTTIPATTAWAREARVALRTETTATLAFASTDTVVVATFDGAVAAALPNSGDGLAAGKQYSVIDGLGTNRGPAKAITLSVSGGVKTINGQTSLTITVPYDGLSVVSDGTNYFVVV